MRRGRYSKSLRVVYKQNYASFSFVCLAPRPSLIAWVRKQLKSVMALLKEQGIEQEPSFQEFWTIQDQRICSSSSQCLNVECVGMPYILLDSHSGIGLFQIIFWHNSILCIQCNSSCFSVTSDSHFPGQVLVRCKLTDLTEYQDIFMEV